MEKRRNTPLEILTAGVFIVFVSLILYFAFWPFKVTTLNTISIDNTEYCRGDWVKIEMDFQKHMDVQAEVKWFIVDGVIFELDSPGVSRPQGDNHIIVEKQVPASIVPGTYHMRVEMTYRVHPLHKPITTSWNTPTFTVLDKDCLENGN